MKTSFDLEVAAAAAAAASCLARMLLGTFT